ncbi:MAG: type VI secretion system Vgr family protein, partial [Planctomycetota bacterium]
PPRPKPRVGGVCTATVVGPGPMNIDKFGRVQVNFPWDRSAKGDSCWVRVAQSWAGNGWGACFWPRVGHEVVVAFEEGDPDRPVIVGSVYNGANMPPFAMPDNMYIAGWKSLTQGGDPARNYHQILMSDEKGAEIVHVHAEGSYIVQQETQQVSFKPANDIHFTG